MAGNSESCEEEGTGRQETRGNLREWACCLCGCAMGTHDPIHICLQQIEEAKRAAQEAAEEAEAKRRQEEEEERLRNRVVSPSEQRARRRAARKKLRTQSRGSVKSRSTDGSRPSTAESDISRDTSVVSPVTDGRDTPLIGRPGARLEALIPPVVAEVEVESVGSGSQRSHRRRSRLSSSARLQQASSGGSARSGNASQGHPSPRRGSAASSSAHARARGSSSSLLLPPRAPDSPGGAIAQALAGARQAAKSADAVVDDYTGRGSATSGHDGQSLQPRQQHQQHQQPAHAGGGMSHRSAASYHSYHSYHSHQTAASYQSAASAVAAGLAIAQAAMASVSGSRHSYASMSSRSSGQNSARSRQSGGQQRLAALQYARPSGVQVPPTAAVGMARRPPPRGVHHNGEGQSVYSGPSTYDSYHAPLSTGAWLV